MNKTFNIKSNTSENKNIYKFFFRKTSTNDEIFNYTKTLIGKNVDINILFPPYLLSCEKSICVTKKPKAIERMATMNELKTFFDSSLANILETMPQLSMN